jgi:hypothetical protein
VFVVHPDGSGLGRSGSTQAPAATSPTGPVRSPDGTRIVLRLFLAGTGEQHLYTVRPAGSDLRHVANTQGSEEFADWGPHPLAG